MLPLVISLIVVIFSTDLFFPVSRLPVYSATPSLYKLFMPLIILVLLVPLNLLSWMLEGPIFLQKNPNYPSISA